MKKSKSWDFERNISIPVTDAFLNFFHSWTINISLCPLNWTQLLFRTSQTKRCVFRFCPDLKTTAMYFQRATYDFAQNSLEESDFAPANEIFDQASENSIECSPATPSSSVSLSFKSGAKQTNTGPIPFTIKQFNQKHHQHEMQQLLHNFMPGSFATGEVSRERPGMDSSRNCFSRVQETSGWEKVHMGGRISEHVFHCNKTSNCR